MYQLSFTAQDLEKLYTKQSTEIVREVSVSDDNYIIVNVDFSIADGTEIKFKSPVDCSQIIGLRVWYKDGDGQAFNDFNFADAHGNNVGNINYLFAENAVVSVILDPASGMAFVQNAATNAYIERTFVKSVNGTTPDADGNVEIVAGGGSGVSSWNDLVDKPTIPTKVSDLEQDITSSWNDLTDKPFIPTKVSDLEQDVTTSWNDLTDKPALFSGSWNDLTDKPFEETVVMTDTLIWDGNTENIYSIEGPASIHYKISDSVPSKADFENGFVIELSNGDRITELDCPLNYYGGYIELGQYCYIQIYSGENYVPGTYFNDLGTSYVKSLTIPGYTGFETKEIKTIEPKYLPEPLQFGESVVTGDTLYWDGQPTEVSFEGVGSMQGVLYFKVSDSTPSVEDLENSSVKCGFFMGPQEVEMSVEIDEHGVILLIMNGLPYIMISPTDLEDMPKGIYFIYSGYTYISYLRIVGYNFEHKTIKAIDSNYMPKHLQLKESTIETDTLTWDGNSSLDIRQDPGGISYRVCDSAPTMEDFANGYVAELSDGSILKGSPYQFSDDYVRITEFGCIIYLVDKADYFGPIYKGIYLSKNPDTGVYLKSLKIPGFTFEVKETKLDKKYIPDSMPVVNSNDNGKFLRVVDGKWAAEAVPYAEEASF